MISKNILIIILFLCLTPVLCFAEPNINFSINGKGNTSINVSMDNITLGVTNTTNSIQDVVLKYDITYELSRFKSHMSYIDSSYGRLYDHVDINMKYKDTIYLHDYSIGCLYSHQFIMEIGEVINTEINLDIPVKYVTLKGSFGYETVDGYDMYEGFNDTYYKVGLTIPLIVIDWVIEYTDINQYDVFPYDKGHDHFISSIKTHF